MRTVGEIKNEIEKLDVMRLKNIDIRDTEKDECKREKYCSYCFYADGKITMGFK